ncbi:MAG TPA: FAD-binding oxidoreductase [Steroidobacteraceae bacterium]
MADQKTVLPPGLNSAEFKLALKALAAAVGDQWVKSDAGTIAAYRDPYATLDDYAFLPSAVISPASVEEVQKVLKVANETNVPLWPVSTGKNYAYGGPAPRMKGTAVLDLRRMNRIIEVNEKLGYVFVEPGVSYFDLYQHLRSIGSKLWVDCAAPGWGSVLGNALERGAGYTPYGDHWGNQCGLEVILANGEIIRTGMGGVPKSKAWGAFKYGFGPYVDGMFTQSNLGVVTKMGMWLMGEPPAVKPMVIQFPREDSLAQIVDAVLPLRKAGIFNGGMMLSGILWEGGGISPRTRWYDGKGAMPASAISQMARDLDMGWWNLVTGLYGTEALIASNFEIIRDAMSSVPGAKVVTESDRPTDPAFAYRKKLMMGEPNMYEFNLINWVPGGGHIAFSPALPLDGAEAEKVYSLCSNTVHAAGFDWMGEFACQLRSCLQVQFLPFNRTDPDERKRAHETFHKLVGLCGDAGYGEYRTQLGFMDAVAKMYNFNDNSFMRLNEAIKDALDPKGILAPGKSGIWPKAIRGVPHA